MISYKWTYIQHILPWIILIHSLWFIAYGPHHMGFMIQNMHKRKFVIKTTHNINPIFSHNSTKQQIWINFFNRKSSQVILLINSNGWVKNEFILNSICRYICSDISTHNTRWANRLPWWTPAWRPAVRHFENRKILSGP